MSRKLLKFRWREGDLELRACPQRLARFSEDEENVTIDFIKWDRKEDGEEYCYSIGYFRWDDHEKWWDLYFVGDRFKEIPAEQAAKVWERLGMAYDVLNTWVVGRDEYDDGWR